MQLNTHQLANDIFMFRSREGISREQLSKLSGVTGNSIREIEEVKSENPKVNIVIKLVYAMGKKVDDYVRN